MDERSIVLLFNEMGGTNEMSNQILFLLTVVHPLPPHPLELAPLTYDHSLPINDWAI